MPRPQDPAKRPLTIKERKLVANVLKTGKKEQSAIDAGYSPRSAGVIASETLRKPNVQAALVSAAAKLGIDPEYILANFKKVIEIHSQTYTKTVGQGENIALITEMIDATAVLKSNELLAKHLNMFSEKLEVVAKIETSTSAEQIELARKWAAIFLGNKK